MFCNHCGKENPDSARFCNSCGEALEPEDITMTLSVIEVPDGPSTDELTQDLRDLEPGDAMLLVRRGPNVGATFMLDVQETTVGRHPKNSIFLDDVTVSRKHAKFVRDGDSFVLYDVGSMNGTYVNGVRVEEHQLARGDEIQIGTFKLVFLTGLSTGT